MDTSKGEVRNYPVGSRLNRNVRRYAKKLHRKRQRRKDKRAAKED